MLLTQLIAKREEHKHNFLKMESGRIVLLTFLLYFVTLQVNGRHLSLQEILEKDEEMRTPKVVCPKDCAALLCDREQGLKKVPYIDENGCDRCKCINLREELEKLAKKVKDEPNSKYHELEEMVLKKSKRVVVPRPKPAVCQKQCEALTCDPQLGLKKVPYIDANGCNRCKCIEFVKELDKLRKEMEGQSDSSEKKQLPAIVRKALRERKRQIQAKKMAKLAQERKDENKNYLHDIVSNVLKEHKREIEAKKRASKRSYHKGKAAKLRQLFQALLAE